ncbi:MAG: hypothetical protein M3R38_27040 [Actinomycetota bacterium]|nr:hypothetical protein [Actinomycetota bacterium]
MSGVVDLGLHRANAAAHEGMRCIRRLKEAEARYAEAKEVRADEWRIGRLGLAADRRCKETAQDVRDAQKAVQSAYEEWEEAERNLLPLGADHGG